MRSILVKYKYIKMSLLNLDVFIFCENAVGIISNRIFIFATLVPLFLLLRAGACRLGFYKATA